MDLIFYKTGFDITKNGVYDDLDDYLGSLDFFSVPGYKYVEPSLAVTVKIPYDSHQRKKTFDYCAMVDGSEVYYYYVTNMKWRGKETLELSLAFDTLNTYWSEIKSGLTDETHITRRFKDRYIAGETVAYPVVDNKQEDFSSVPMDRKSITKVNPLSSTQKWYLAYMTLYAQSDESLTKNPVNCFAIPEKDTYMERGGTTLTWTSGQFGTSNVAFAVTSLDNPTFKISLSNGMTIALGDYCKWAVIIYHGSSKNFEVKYRIYDTTNKRWVCNYQSNITSIVFKSCMDVYQQDYTAMDEIKTGVEDNNNDLSGNEMSYDTPTHINAGAEGILLTNFQEWYTAHKTNSTLIKLREIPYAPFLESYNVDKLVLPENWVYYGGTMRFVGNAFSENVLETVDAVNMEALTKDEVIDQVDEGLYETKMLNSAYNLSKFVYDTQTWAVQPERLTSFDDAGKGKVIVSYKVSDGIDNGSIFRFQNDQTQDTDFGEFMVVDKSTDLPYFTNEYLNYLRYGKKIDEKNATWNLVSTIFSSVGGGLNSVASGAFGGSSMTEGGGMAGGIVGGMLALANAAVQIIKTVDTYRDEINSKIDSYTHQASSVSGTSDVSLFNVYSGNKLLLINYAPKREVKDMLLDYFRFYGYADDCYAVPDFNSRRWVDYVKCEPVFQNDMVWNDFLGDIKARMEAGFHVFHRVDGNYDLKIKQENWETSLWKWAHQE